MAEFYRLAKHGPYDREKRGVKRLLLFKREGVHVVRLGPQMNRFTQCSQDIAIPLSDNFFYESNTQCGWSNRLKVEMCTSGHNNFSKI
jgi:hypothetical protein